MTISPVLFAFKQKEVSRIWLKSFHFEGKTLSSIELLTLLQLNETYMEATAIIERISKAMAPYYQPERGTIYPILHRLHKHNLIERAKGRKLMFRLSKLGENFLANIHPMLVEQIVTFVRFIEIVDKSLIEMNAFHTIEYLKQVKQIVDEFQSHIVDDISLAEKKDRDEGWVNISIDD